MSAFNAVAKEHRSCPACAAKEWRGAFRAENLREGIRGEWAYVKCLSCQTLYLDPIPAAAELETAYRQGDVDPVPPEPSAAPASPKSFLRRRIGAWIGRPHSWPEEEGQGRSILDFGCLSGNKLREFHQRGWDVMGVDLNEPAIAQAQAEFPEGRFLAGDIRTLDPSLKFDVIRTDNVIEHIPEPLEILENLRERLKPGGRLLIYVPAATALSIRLFKEKSASSWAPFHVQLFSERGLRTLLDRAGFGRVEVSQYTPLSWWEITARQLVAAPGFIRRRPSRVERSLQGMARLLSPVWILGAKAGFGEELVAVAQQP